MSTFAQSTKVGEAKTRQEIEALLVRVGAQQFGTVTDFEARQAIIGFKYKNLSVKMSIPLPDPNDKQFRYDGRGYVRPDAKRVELAQAEIRRRWRCLLLALKAKMVATQDGISTFEQEFMPYFVTATGETIYEVAKPAIEEAKKSGMLNRTLALPSGGGE